MPALHGSTQTLEAKLGVTATDPVVFVVTYADEGETGTTITTVVERTSPTSVNGTVFISLLGPAPSGHTYKIKEIQLVQPNAATTRVTCSLIDGATEGLLFDFDLDQRDHVWAG